MIAPRGSRLVAHPLLDHAPLPGTGKKEGMVIKLVPILHCCAVDLRRDAARVNKRPEIEGQPLAPFTYFERSLRDVAPLTPWE